jgi:hypothetical protein
VGTFLGGDLAPLEDNGKVRGPDAGIVKVVKLQSFEGVPSPRADHAFLRVIFITFFETEYMSKRTKAAE